MQRAVEILNQRLTDTDEVQDLDGKEDVEAWSHVSSGNVDYDAKGRFTPVGRGQTTRGVDIFLR